MVAGVVARVDELEKKVGPISKDSSISALLGALQRIKMRRVSTSENVGWDETGASSVASRRRLKRMKIRDQSFVWQAKA